MTGSLLGAPSPQRRPPITPVGRVAIVIGALATVILVISIVSANLLTAAAMALTVIGMAILVATQRRKREDI